MAADSGPAARAEQIFHNCTAEVDNVSEISERVVKLVAEKMSVDPEQITPETHFINDLQSDSLDMAELVIELEEEFNITISEEDAQSIETVGQAIKFIEENQ